MTDVDQLWMRRALSLAASACGCVEPNPMVGAVVLDAAGAFAGEGSHRRFGGPHAEVNALAAAGERAAGGTLYVTLEPCCHVGKTPPCTNAVLAAGIRRVVVAMIDPFPKVAGGGLAILRRAGIAVELGGGEAEAQALNAPYLKLMQTGMPWIIGKWAMTLDGRTATRTGDSRWISNEAARASVHELRGRVDAIVVGAGTVRYDDPTLTARPPGPRTPMRVIVTASGNLPFSGKLCETIGEAPILLATTAQGASRLASWRNAGAEVIAFPESNDVIHLPALLAQLGRRRFTNVLVEGGAGLLGSLHDEGLLDETWVYVGAKLIGGADSLSPIGGRGVGSMREAREPHSTTMHALGDTMLIRSRFTSP